MLSLIAAVVVAPADLVIENARIWSDGMAGFAEFAAVRGGRFVAVGKQDDTLVGPSTVRLDAKGAVVIPGLIDSHIHMLGGGHSLSALSLREAKSREEFVARIKAHAEKLGKNDWVLGRGWSVESWPSQEPPRKEWLDAVTGGRPAILERMDGHSAVANSEALKRAGITKDGPPDPPGGSIDRDPNGEPTGILRETASALVDRLVPPPTAAQNTAALKAAIRHANANGITGVCDIPSISDLAVYRELAKEKLPTMRFFLYPTSGDWRAAASLADQFPKEPGWVQIKGFKCYMDGSLGSHTAYMRQPFSFNPPDKPQDFRGLPMPGALDGTYARNFQAASQAGYQCIAHAIGDEGNHLLLDLYEKNIGFLPRARARSEHAQHLLPEDIERFAKLGVIASMQPYHKADDGRYAERHIGAERCKSSYAYKRLLDAGVVLAFGSDWPVVDLNPFLGMEAAVTGKIMTGNVWEPDNNISAGDALRAYTTSAAYAAFAEGEVGKIAPGYRADFVVLQGSPFGAKVSWETIKPSRTYVQGRQVYPVLAAN